jgi:hypothetical protein
MQEKARKQMLSRLTALKQERSSWDSHYKEISDNLLPRSGRFFLSDRNKGEKRHNNIYDSTGIRALETLTAGMMSGANSPARPWHRLTTSDPELDESAPVKKWLTDVRNQQMSIFARSNTYRSLHMLYEELGAFGTGASIIVPHFKNVIHHYPQTVGQYCIAEDNEGKVNTIYREFSMSVVQMVREFGRAKCSLSVQNMYDRGSLDAFITIYHAIEPRADRDLSKNDNLNMAYRSTYFEAGGNEDQLLSESGFKEFIAICPRWAVQGGDIYGNSPAMKALGDIKALQHKALRKAQAIDLQTNPPLQAPTSVAAVGVNRLPGGVTYADSPSQIGGVRTAYEVNLRLDFLLQDIQDNRQLVREAFHSDLFLMLANSNNGQMTATEVAERHEEKLLMLGPTIERVHNEMLAPMVEMTFARQIEAGTVPPPPPELQGKELSIEFVSMLAQAQRAVATNSVDRFVANLGVVASMKPEVLDKFDQDRWADVYADAQGIDPELIVPSDKVALIRQARAQQMAQQQANEQAAQAADAASKLGRVNTSQPNLLTDATQAFSGYT